MKPINRRQILQYTAWITGGAVSAPLAGVILSGCAESSNGEHAASGNGQQLPVLHFFAPEQFVLLTLIADTLLPRTDSPSASDVQVPTTIDTMLGRVLEPDYRAWVKTLWADLESQLEQQGFAQLAPPSQVELLRSLELSDDAALVNARRGLLEIKQQAVAYYLASEEVAVNHLNYLPIPGSYQPCISVEDVNNTAWAIHR